MTYDPYRNEFPQHQHRDYRDPNDTGAGGGLLLGAIMLLVLGGFVYFFANTDAQKLATHEPRPPITQPSTTGSGAAPESPASETTGSSSGMTMPEPKSKPVE